MVKKIVCVTIAPRAYVGPGLSPAYFRGGEMLDRVIVRDDEIGPFRFDKARNQAAAHGRETGADWILHVDTDMQFHGTLDLEALDPSVGVYGVERAKSPDVFFRSPLLVHRSCAGWWRGRTHEFFNVPATPLDQAFWYTEPPKGAHAIYVKGTRDERLLLEQITEEPRGIRWRMYLGQTLAMLHRYHEARAVYASAPLAAGSAVSRWEAEQQAWCFYQAARISADALCEDRAAERYARLALAAWPGHAESLLLLAELHGRAYGEPPGTEGRAGFVESGITERFIALGGGS